MYILYDILVDYALSHYDYHLEIYEFSGISSWIFIALEDFIIVTIVFFVLLGQRFLVSASHFIPDIFDRVFSKIRHFILLDALIRIFIYWKLPNLMFCKKKIIILKDCLREVFKGYFLFIGICFRWLPMFAYIKAFLIMKQLS